MAIGMYVYFNTMGEIQAICPSENQDFSTKFTCARFPVSDVEMFLTGKANVLDFNIFPDIFKDFKKYKLIKKPSHIVYTRRLDSYMTKIETVPKNHSVVTIYNCISTKVITVSVNDLFKEMYNNGDEEKQMKVLEFLSQGNMEVYITKKNDPYTMFCSINFSSKDLFNKEDLKFTYEYPCSDTSAYSTRRMIDSYVYMETK